jgi:hypothetical protein
MERLDDGLWRCRSTCASCCHSAATGADTLFAAVWRQKEVISAMLT